MSTPWQNEQVFHDGDSYFTHVMQSIAEAKHQISIEMYIFDLDQLGMRMIEALLNAAHRGVVVKLLIDGVGGSSWDFNLAESYRRQGLEIRFFHPLAWQKSSKKIWQTLNIRSVVFGFRKLQRRNHRKAFVIDGSRAYIGSMNVSDRHLMSINGKDAWRDTGVFISGEGVRALEEAFFATWTMADPPWTKNWYERYLESFRRFARHLHPRLILNYTFQQRRKHHAHIIQAIENAKQRVLITNPYFVPDPKLMQSLVRRAGQIDIRLLLTEKTDFFGVQFAMESCFTDLLKAGVKIYQYRPSLLHAKILVIDDQIVLGSSNIDHLSLFQNFEADLVLSSEESKKSIEMQFQRDLSNSKCVEINQWNQRPLLNKLLERLFYSLRVCL